MTVKEIADFTGKTERCVRKWIVKAGEKSSSVEEKNSSAGHGKIADYTIDEVEQILLSGSLSKDAVSILMQNARNNPHNIQISSSLNEKDIALISSIVSMTVAKTIEVLDKRMQKIETVVEERKAILPPPEMSKRKQLVMIINNYCNKSGVSQQEAYNRLYNEAYYRLGINFKVQASNRGVKAIDIAEQNGKLDDLISIASMF